MWSAGSSRSLLPPAGFKVELVTHLDLKNQYLHVEELPWCDVCVGAQYCKKNKVEAVDKLREIFHVCL